MVHRIEFLLFLCRVTVQANTASPLMHVHPQIELLKQWTKQVKWQREHSTETIAEIMESVPKFLILDAESQSCPQNCSICTERIVQFGVDFGRKKPYTLEVMDADGKPQSGVFKGNIRWNGRYYECQTVQSETFKGKWCEINFGTQIPVLNEGTGLGMSLGICMPDACCADYLNTRLQLLANVSGIEIHAKCPEQPSAWKTVDIVCTAVFGVVAGVVALGTSVHMMSDTNDEDVSPSIVSNGLYFKKNGRFRRWLKAAICFSIIKNTRGLLNTERQRDTIDVLHGIRFFSIAWVVLGHSYIIPMLYIENFIDVTTWYTTSFSFQIVSNAVYSVDTFFLISGILVTYVRLNEMARRGGKLNAGKMYLLRYLRLTPPYAATLLFIVGIFGKIGNGPMWPDAIDGEKDACKSYWWTNLLYINNLYPATMLSECFVLGWYLANDMQFFLLAPISLLLLYKRPKIGIHLLLFGILGSVLVTGVLSAHFKQIPQAVLISQLIRQLSTGQNSSVDAKVGLPPVSATETFWSDLYTKPWCRIGVYLIGVITGYILHVTKRKIRMSTPFVVGGWIVAFLLSSAILFGLWPYISADTPMPISLAAFYNAMCRVVWGLAVAWVVISCACGYGGPVSVFLSWSAFIPLSRLSYCLYLVHSLVILWWHSTEEVAGYFTNKQYAFQYVGTLGVSIAAAYVFSMLFEAPVISLTKLVANYQQNSQETPVSSLVSEEERSESDMSG